MPLRSAASAVLLLTLSACALNRGGLNPDAGRRDGGGFDAGCGPSCDDMIGCTTDRCVSGTCVHSPMDDACASGETCTLDMGCISDDCNAFTCSARDMCERVMCVGPDCVRSPACTATEMCCAGACQPIGCNDGDPCTADACGAAGCEHTPLSGNPCDDGVFCNGMDSCLGGRCDAHTGDPCPGLSACEESLLTCTGCVTDADCPADVVPPFGGCEGFTDVCDETGIASRTVTTFTCVAGGRCDRADIPESMACGRSTTGLDCAGETCPPFPGCAFPDSCAETAPPRVRTCTRPICAGGTCSGTGFRMESLPCTRTTTGLTCNDMVFCNGMDTCAGGACSVHPGNPCRAPIAMCIEATDSCVECTMASHCNDSNPCTTDSCNASGRCQFVNNSAPCNDGMFCNGMDTCGGGSCSIHPGNPCSGVTPMCVEATDSCAECTMASHCNDGNPCTTDSCNAATGRCQFVNNTAPCSDGTFCNGMDSCGGGSCSVHPGNPCSAPTPMCIEASDSCVECTMSSQCNDSNPCTNDSCNTSTGRCQFMNNTAPCDDGMFCNGVDVCSGGACSHPGNPCSGMTRICIEATETCVGCLVPGDCNDMNPCTADACDASMMCTNTLLDCDGMCGGAGECPGSPVCTPVPMGSMCNCECV